MNGTMKQWTLLAMGLALACASVGCVTSDDPGSDTEADDTEEVDTATQQLEELDAPLPEGEEDSNEAPTLDEGAVDDGESGEPQPVPWRVFMASPLPDDGSPIDPLSAPSKAAPSGGHGK